MFGLDPFSRPVAIIEIILLLSLTAFIGWLLARLIMNGRIRSLKAEIAGKETALADCRRAKVSNVAKPVASAPVPPVLKTTLPPEVPVTAIQESTTVPASDAGVSVKEQVNPAASVVSTSSAIPVARAGNSEAAVLSRIASRASELNFDRIGHATAADADDLKEIVGIGPFLERKLHSLGIYTFRQVSNFTKEDINKVNEIIEFFPGRIDRDNWVGQAKAFYESKNG